MLCSQIIKGCVGRRSIVDMASAYGAKGPRFTSRWRHQFIKFMNVCSAQFDENKAPIGPNLLKKIKIKKNKKNKRLPLNTFNSQSSSVLLFGNNSKGSNIHVYQNLQHALIFALPG